MSDVEDSEGCGNDTNDLHQDRPTQVTRMEGSPVRQTMAKTYTSSLLVPTVRGSREIANYPKTITPATNEPQDKPPLVSHRRSDKPRPSKTPA